MTNDTDLADQIKELYLYFGTNLDTKTREETVF